MTDTARRTPPQDDAFAALRADVAAIRSHPLIPDTVNVGGFLYDVDTGRLEHRA